VLARVNDCGYSARFTAKLARQGDDEAIVKFIEDGTTMPNRREFLIFCSTIAGPHGAAGQSKSADSISIAANSASGPAVEVKVESVTKVFISPNIPAYLISYSYDFGGRDSVYLKGMGNVPAKGAFSHFVKDLELQFSASPTGSPIVTVPLKPTVTVAAKAPLNEVPGENQFPSGFRAFSWDASSSLQERVDDVLGRYFHYLPRENNKLTYLATTFSPLELSRKLSQSGVVAQVSLLVSFPWDPVARKYSFHVQSLVKEGRTLSDELRATNNGDILAAADAFVDRLVLEMKKGGQPKP
jgi:hypothetical protein